MDIGLLLLRLAVGLTIAVHGAKKLFGWFGGPGLEGTGQFFEMIGFQPGRRYATIAGAAELGGGFLLAVGFATPLGAAAIIATMIVAVFATNINKGFFSQNGGYEYNVLLGSAAIAITFTGPGPLSLDRLVGVHMAGTVWDLLALFVAILASIAVLAQRRSAVASVK